MTETQYQAIFRYGVPDLSLPAEERGLFSLAANKEVVEENLPLHDARTAGSNLVKGAAGLDAQGFVYIKHQSALSKSDLWFSGQNVEEIYLPECEDLICKLTGAKRAVVNNVAFRRRLADKQVDKNFVIRKGDELDQEIAKFPRDKALVYGKEEGGSLEPARLCHVDYTSEGLRQTVRYCRKDFNEAGKEALAAEDVNTGRKEGEEEVKVPRYAAYSVWRPVRTVRRDPLAVLDWRSLDKSSLVTTNYRALSDVNSSGEYLLESWGVLPPKKPENLRWYWMPEQEPDDLLIIKFADTAADEDPNIAGACVHCSPEVPGTEDEEPRLSIEARVLAFW